MVRKASLITGYLLALLLLATAYASVPSAPRAAVATHFLLPQNGALS